MCSNIAADDVVEIAKATIDEHVLSMP
ncbi:hypothetical protein A2U01_0104180, partial [Trifolium medium]|nr:hypothetical protein [Trifolium medium]